LSLLYFTPIILFLFLFLSIPLSLLLFVLSLSLSLEWITIGGEKGEEELNTREESEDVVIVGIIKTALGLAKVKFMRKKGEKDGDLFWFFGRGKAVSGFFFVFFFFAFFSSFFSCFFFF